uniref:RIIa domain-containing protein 1-like n=1 Tax=Pristiophorus japonicus TaxID=55135 RepID=UPI00398F0F4C
MEGADEDAEPQMPPPVGSESYDLDALSQRQQDLLYEFKIDTRIANEYYLRKHPEVELLLGDFMRSVLLKRPKNIRGFAAEYYTDLKLPEKIRQKLHEREKMRHGVLTTQLSTSSESPRP